MRVAQAPGAPFDATELLRRKRSAKGFSVEAFWAKVARADASDCWEWQGRRNRKGYGRLTWGMVDTTAHRVAYSLANGPIEAGLLVRHACDNPACCNPTHLDVGTVADNNRDTLERGRWRMNIGGDNGRAKLTEAVVFELRLARAAGETTRSLAARAGVALCTLRDAVRGVSWGHVPMPISTENKP